MDDNSDGKLIDGIRVITLSSWKEFQQNVRDLKSRRGFVWRGQKKDETSGWSLLSSFDRRVHSKNQDDRVKKLKRHINNFKDAMNKFYPNVLPNDDIDIWAIWALGQHYGLKTPLLDWTLSPYIAAYFAFIEVIDNKDRDDRYRYVFALNRSLERLMSKLKKTGQTISRERSVPFIDQLLYPNPRFTAQKGIFTKAFRGIDLGNYVQSFARKRPGEVIIVKFRIPTKEREKCLSELHLMNIDHTSLLLDFRDVVDGCNNKL